MLKTDSIEVFILQLGNDSNGEENVMHKIDTAASIERTESVDVTDHVSFYN